MIAYRIIKAEISGNRTISSITIYRNSALQAQSLVYKANHALEPKNRKKVYYRLAAANNVCGTGHNLLRQASKLFYSAINTGEYVSICTTNWDYEEPERFYSAEELKKFIETEKTMRKLI